MEASPSKIYETYEARDQQPTSDMFPSAHQPIVAIQLHETIQLSEIGGFPSQLDQWISGYHGIPSLGHPRF